MTIDIGAYYRGFHTDYATTFIVGTSKDAKTDKFLRVGKETLDRAILQAKVGNYLGNISEVIEDGIYSNGYHIIEQLTGHGVGHELHEDPFVQGYLDKNLNETLKIRAGLVLAIEVIYSMGTEHIANEKGNNWSIVTADESLSACFEHTVAITDKKYVYFNVILWYNYIFMKDNVLVVEGEVVENLPNTLFRVKLLNSEKVILCYLSGKMRKNYIKILPETR